jgi:hypothetical protein
MLKRVFRLLRSNFTARRAPREEVVVRWSSSCGAETTTDRCSGEVLPEVEPSRLPGDTSRRNGRRG